MFPLVSGHPHVYRVRFQKKLTEKYAHLNKQNLVVWTDVHFIIYLLLFYYSY